jgi:hypothetical protein
MAPPTLSYGLNLASRRAPSKADLKGTAGQKRKKTIFDSDSDDDQDGGAQGGGGDSNRGGVVEIATLGGLSSPRSPRSPKEKPSDEPSAKRRAAEKQKSPLPTTSAKTKTGGGANGAKNFVNLSSLHASKKHAQEAASLDPTIYDYDAIYDSLHPEKKKSTSAATDPDGASQGPKYIGALLRSAEVRKRDQLRARDKLLAREREAEGDEFADKEKFVTAAYRAQQEEVRRIEAEEAEREKLEEERRKKGLGMTSFYKDVLERDEKKHEEAMRAAAEAAARKRAGSLEDAEKNAAAAAAETPGEEKSAEQIAAELNARGARIIVNEEGEVVDKRQLLSAGLNVAPKPKAAATAGKESSASRAAAAASRPSDRAGGPASARTMQRARQTEMIATQLEERVRKEREEEEKRLRELAEKNKSKKAESDIMSAKERYLARKREREKAKEQGT